MIEVVEIPKQTPLTVLSFDGTIADSENEASDDVACVGHSKLYGIIYSDVEVTLNIKEATSDEDGTIYYDYSEDMSIPAVDARKIILDICGKAIKLTVSNNSGGDASVRCFFSMRPF